MTILTVLKVRHSFFVAIYSNEHSDENICAYDYIGADLPVYFFEKFDRQNFLQFGDEAYSIILNTACSPEKVPEPLKALFEYINDPTKGSGMYW